MDRNFKQKEDGLILVTFSLAALSIFILIGLAVDSANLYIAKLNTQAAVDAASMSGLGQVVTQIPVPDALRSARFVARGNLVANRFDEARFNWDPDNNAGGVLASWNGRIMEVQVTLDVPLYILGGLPGMGIGETIQVRALGRAAIRNSNIAMVLDTSGSMACPQVPGAGNMACPCLGEATDCEQGDGSGARIASLKPSAREFVENFNEDDGISVTAFGHGAEIIQGFPPVGNRTNLNQLRDRINLLTAEGTTNLSDGILTSYLDAEARGRTEDLFFVVFSDGAPTAARFWFDAGAINGAVRGRRNDVINNVTPGSGAEANYDYLSWGLFVPDPASIDPTNPDLVPIPNRLYHNPPNNRGGFGNYWNKRKFSGVDVPTPPSVVVASGTAYRSIADINNPRAVFMGQNGQLFNHLTVRMPNNTPVRLGRPQLWDASCTNGFCWDQWVQGRESFWIYTDLAIHYADFVRQATGAVFFVIGYGQPAGAVPEDGTSGVSCSPMNGGVNVNCADPYQDIHSANWRKDLTNRRIALTLCGYNDPPFYGVDLEPLQALLRVNVRSHGDYYATDNEENLRAAFDRIARRIRMRRASNLR